MKSTTLVSALFLFFLASPAARADNPSRADAHAPIGIMADHIHARGEWMFSYRFMSMDMGGNLQGSSAIDPDTIVTTQANPFAGMPDMPPTLRVVPLSMQMDMNMFGAMYAPTDRVTLMLMANHLEKRMRHVTYSGGMGTTELGEFTTATSGWGDLSVNALISLFHRPHAKVHAIVGMSVPTGSTDESGEILAPTGMRPTVRLPYPMQLGSGSYDPIAGLSYAGFASRVAWGGQWRGTFRSSNNDDGYRLGDEHRLTGWLSYLFANPVSASVRLEFYDRGNISGQDLAIMAPVQTADPQRAGGQRTDLGVGINYAGQGGLAGWRAALEYTIPVRQNLDGPQLETDGQLLFGIQKAFK